MPSGLQKRHHLETLWMDGLSAYHLETRWMDGLQKRYHLETLLLVSEGPKADCEHGG